MVLVFYQSGSRRPRSDGSAYCVRPFALRHGGTKRSRLAA